MLKRTLILSLFAGLSGCLGACSSDASGGESAESLPPSGNQAPGGTGVSLGGAQDFGLFRDILSRGEIPAPNTIDAPGFFAEHKLDYPAADCGEDLCVHGLLGMQRNMIDGGDCVVLQVGLNSPLRPDAANRPPLDLVLAIDVSGSMRGEPLDAVQRGLDRMVDALRPEDRVSIVTYSDVAQVVLQDVSDPEALRGAISGLRARGATNLYDGLFTAYAVADALVQPGRAQRVVYLSDGQATAGILDAGRLRSLAEGYARQGIAITTIGVGADFDVETMRNLSEVGAGNFYFLEDIAAVEEVFVEEVETFLMPVALDVEIDVQLGPGYTLLGAYGANNWTGGTSGGSLRAPSLFLADRQRADAPIEGGRRGGGGGVLIEVRADREALSQMGRLVMTWRDPVTGERLRQTTEIVSPTPDGSIPEGGWFTDDTVQKGFVMLNLFVGLRMAAELARDGDAGTAIGVLQALHGQVDNWLSDFPDPDVEDDLLTVERFIEVLDARGSNTPISRPPNPWPVD